MSDDRVAAFEAQGLPRPDAESRARLIGGVDRWFTRNVGGPPAWRWFVPGRIEIFGKHTDYAGGRSLLAAVPRGMVVAARPRDDALVCATDVVSGEAAVVDSANGDVRHDGWSRYVQVVARRFALNFPGARLGIDLALASDLPRAAGLSSSSALVVGVATALARRGELASRPEWLAHITSTPALAWYLGSVENGLDYPGLPGSDGVGTHGGSEDHTAILACRPGHVSQYRYVPVTHLGDVPMPADWTFVVATSGVHADKAGSVRDQYNRASLTTRALCEIWNRAADVPAASLGRALASGADAVERLRALVADAGAAPFPAAELRQRLDHFVAEDGRVPQAAAAILAGDGHRLGELAGDSQRQADEWLGNQIDETRVLTRCALESGAFAASSFGAGFGGSVWALVEAVNAPRLASHWVESYRRQMPPKGPVESFIARPGPPLMEVTD